MECSALDGSELDKDLLTALDEMLFSGAPDAQQIETGCHLADAFGPAADGVGNPSAIDGGAELSLETPVMDAHQQKEEPQESKTPSTSQNHLCRGKDVRPAPYVKPKPRRRKRSKDELDYLRAQVTGLQEELGKLSAMPTARADGARDDKIFSQWKEIADRQKAETNRSVVQNLKLRSMLEGQLRVAKSLEAAIQCQQEEATQLLTWHREGAEMTAVGGRRPRVASWSDDVIFVQLNVGLESQYADFDTVMDSTGLGSVLQSSNDIETVHGADGIAFRHEEARLLPFSVPAVHRAMWSCVRYGKAKELAGHIHTRVLNNDHLNVTITDKVQLPKSHRFDMCARLAMRRYFEQSRIVIVWSGYVEITGSLFVRLHEKGFTSVSAFDFGKKADVDAGSASSGSVPGCVLRMALQIKPEMDAFESQQEARDHVGEVTDLVVGSYHRNFGMMYQIIDSLLFSGSTGGEEDEHELARFAAY